MISHTFRLTFLQNSFTLSYTHQIWKRSAFGPLHLQHSPCTFGNVLANLHEVRYHLLTILNLFSWIVVFLDIDLLNFIILDHSSQDRPVPKSFSLLLLVLSVNEHVVSNNIWESRYQFVLILCNLYGFKFCERPEHIILLWQLNY